MCIQDMIRRNIYDAIDDLYQFCRQDHFRTHKIIDFVKEFIIDDDELLKFLNNCINGTEDPRGNDIFRKNRWPNLDVKTNIQEEDFKQFIRDIPTITKYNNVF